MMASCGPSLSVSSAIAVAFFPCCAPPHALLLRARVLTRCVNELLCPCLFGWPLCFLASLLSFLVGSPRPFFLAPLGLDPFRAFLRLLPVFFGCCCISQYTLSSFKLVVLRWQRDGKSQACLLISLSLSLSLLGRRGSAISAMLLR